MLTNRIKNVPESIAFSLNAKVKQMKKEGVDIVGFTVGEPDFATPQFIVDAAKKALDMGYTKYTDTSGIPELRQALVEKLKKDNGLTYSANQIIVSAGAKQSLTNVMQVLIQQGDEVIIPAPYWLSYPEFVTLAEGTNVFVDTQKTKFKLTPEALKKAITKKTKLLILNSPSNPCGTVYTRAELEALASVIVESDIFVISDEIYEHLIDDSETHVSLGSFNRQIFEKTITINGMSKSFAMTGWRIGYMACANDSIVKACANLQSHATANPNTIAQYAALEGLKNGAKFMEECRQVFNERRKLICWQLLQIKGVSVIEPLGAFYILPDVSGFYNKKYNGETIKDSLDFARLLLEHKHVAVVPGSAFGAPNTIRLSYACSLDEIKKGVARIAEFIQDIK